MITNNKYLEVNNLTIDGDIYDAGDILQGEGIVGEGNCSGYLIDNLDEYYPTIDAK